MAFTDDEINEFRVEAEELLDNAEKGLLAIDKGESFSIHYDSIFRAFHSIKGAAGMMEMPKLQAHMHDLENILTSQSTQESLKKSFIETFLKGTDGARNLLHNRPLETHVSINPSLEKVIQPTPIPAPQTQTVAPVKKSALVKEQGKVLVVDDEPDLVDILVNLLESIGLEVKGTESPIDALKLIESFQPDAILSDVMMPKMNGIQLLDAIRANHPDLPVIFVSGHVTKESLIEAIKLGVFGIIEKPFSGAKVIESCISAVKFNRVMKLLNSSINLIMYQFHDLDAFLKAHGKNDVRGVISRELESLFEQRRILRSAKKTVSK